MNLKKKKNILLIILILFIIVNLNFYIFSDNSIEANNYIKIEVSDDLPNVDLSKLPKINYDALNESWYHQKIEMLIITPPNKPDFVDAVTPLMDWKNEKGVKTIILSNFTEYGGTDNDKAEKLRIMIKAYYEKENIQWVLLAGDAQDNLIPIRKVYNPDVIDVGQGDIEHGGWNNYYKPTDYYYADLTGIWDDNNNGKYGESISYSGYTDEISWTPDVYVGRFPVNNATELGYLVNKTLKYETDPMLGDWMNKMLLAGAVSSTSPAEDEARLTEFIWKNFVLSEMNFTHLNKTTSSFTPEIPPLPNEQYDLTKNNFDSHFDKGFSAVIFAGHGGPKEFNSYSLGSVYSSANASSSNNTNMPSLVYADACTTSPYDMTNDSIGEVLIMLNNSGAIGYIGALRVSWYYEDDTYLEKLNRGNAKLFWEEFFVEGKYQQGKALYDSKVSYMNSDYFARGEASMTEEWQRKNVLTYCLLGDPEVDIYTNTPSNLTNPFTGKIYEGQLVSIVVRDINGNPIPNARINLKSNDGKYRTVYANENGNAKFRLLPQAKETYNAIITGHNVVPSYFTFKTLADDVDPELNNLNCTPTTPTVSDNIGFNVNISDSYSGVESVFLLISNNSFIDYSYIRLSNQSQEDENIFNSTINKLDPGEYSFLIVARDHANNIGILNKKNFQFMIPKPMMDYVLFIALIMIINVTGISVYIIYSGIKKYALALERFEHDLNT